MFRIHPPFTPKAVQVLQAADTAEIAETDHMRQSTIDVARLRIVAAPGADPPLPLSITPDP
jgi:hypothetical protein